MKKVNFWISCFMLVCFTSLSLSASTNNSNASVNHASLAVFDLLESPTGIVTKDYVKDATYLSLDRTELARIFATRPKNALLSIPQKNGTNVKIYLTQQEVLSKDFVANTSDGKPFDYTPGVYYQGTVLGHEKSLAAVSFFADHVMGVMAYGNETYVLGHLQQDVFPAGDEYIFYKESDMVIKNTFVCGTEDSHVETVIESSPETGKSSVAKSVKIYFEADNDTFRSKGNNTANTINYVTAFFNVVQVLYANESILTEISEVFVWTSNDPYNTSTSNGALNGFQSRRSNYNGDIAHLVSTSNDNTGGIAYVDALCSTYGYAYSNIGTSFSQFPTYSWTVQVVTHEIGHNLGSPHTQSCSWPSGALDNCYPTEGNCSPGPSPSNGGTIMSYCHLSSAGINFNNGFGYLPGNLIRSRVRNVGCLTESTLDEDDEPVVDLTRADLTQGEGTVSQEGNKIKVKQSIKNNGDRASTSSVIGYFLSTDATLSEGSDYFLGTKGYPPVGAGVTSSKLSYTKNVSSTNVPVGTYYLIYVVDYFNTNEEHNETDNTFFYNDPLVVITEDVEEEEEDGGDIGGGNEEEEEEENSDDEEEEEEETTTYCESAGGSAAFEWIQSVSIGDNSYSSQGNDGYGDFTEVTFELNQGSVNPVSLQAGYSGGATAEFWKIWIDFNKNDLFEPSELMFESDEPKTFTTTGELTIPADALTGSTRMRVSMKWFAENNQSQNACGSFGYGEVEDYTVNIIGEETGNDDDDNSEDEENDNDNDCQLSTVEVSAQSPCNGDNEYIQNIIVTYECEGIATANVYINGELYKASTVFVSPTTISLTNLPADGMSVNMSVELCQNGSCSTIGDNTFIAPASCQNDDEGGDEDTGDEGNDDEGGDDDTGDEGNDDEGGDEDTGDEGNDDEGGDEDTGDEGNDDEGGDDDTGDGGNDDEGGDDDTGDEGNDDEGGDDDTGDEGNDDEGNGACNGYTAGAEATNITTNSAMANWNESAEAVYYSLRYRQHLGFIDFWGSWKEFSYLQSAGIRLNSLNAGSRYEFSVRVLCDGIWTDWSPSVEFQTLSNLPAAIQQGANPTAINVMVYPNPVKEELNIILPTATEYPVTVVDINGKVIQQLNAQEGTNQVDVSHLTHGIYFIRTIIDGKVSTERFVKTK